MTVKNKFNKFFLFLLIPLLLSSCGDNVVFDSNLVLEDKSWNWREKAQFEVEINDVSRIYNININTRINGDYPFSNLFVLLTAISPEGDTSGTRADLPLFMPDGTPLGSKKGSVLEYRIPVIRNFTFNKPGKYIFILEQNMRKNTLPGVLDIGLAIEDTGEKF